MQTETEYQARKGARKSESGKIGAGGPYKESADITDSSHNSSNPGTEKGTGNSYGKGGKADFQDIRNRDLKKTGDNGSRCQHSSHGQCLYIL